MKKTIIIITLLTSLFTACSFNNAAYPNPSYPNPAQSSEDYLPNPADANLSRSAAYVDLTDLLTMESFPLQFSLHITGNLPTPCHQLRILKNQPDPQSQIRLDVYSVVDPNMVCAEVLEPFEVNVPLGSYPAGHYIVIVNGTPVAEFDA